MIKALESVALNRYERKKSILESLINLIKLNFVAIPIFYKKSELL